MSFWSQSSDPRRIRTNPRSGAAFRETSPESDMFFDSTSNFGFPRSNLADRLGSSVFEDFPTRRTMRSFPSHSESPAAFGSRHRHRQNPGNWSASVDDWNSPADPEWQESSSPKVEGRTSTLRRPFFQRSESIPVRVSHESHRGSRSSTPESTGSSHSHGSSHSKSNSNDRESNAGDEGGIPEGIEEHPGVSARTGRQSFTARRQPKVHHIPIHVEPRDGLQPVVLTPPTDVTVVGGETETTGVGSPSTPRKRNVQHPVFAMPAPDDARRCRPDPPQATVIEEPVADDSPAHSIPIRVDDTEVKGEEDVASSPPSTRDRKKLTPVELVEQVWKDVEKLQMEVSEFTGAKGDKQYLFLDEMLTRSLIKLDNISTDGNEELRKARRAVVVLINSCIQSLEQRASHKENGGEDDIPIRETEDAPDQTAEESNDVREGEIPINSSAAPDATETKDKVAVLQDTAETSLNEDLAVNPPVAVASIDEPQTAETVDSGNGSENQLQNPVESESQKEAKDDGTPAASADTETISCSETAMT